MSCNNFNFEMGSKEISERPGGKKLNTFQRCAYSEVEISSGCVFCISDKVVFL